LLNKIEFVFFLTIVNDCHVIDFQRQMIRSSCIIYRDAARNSIAIKQD